MNMEKLLLFFWKSYFKAVSEIVYNRDPVFP